MRASIPILVALLALPALVAPVAAQDDETVRYLLPAPAGQALLVAAGNGAPTGRRALERYAFDFRATQAPSAGSEDESASEPVVPGFTVVAARGGTVVGQRSSVADGGCPQRSSGPRPD